MKLWTIVPESAWEKLDQHGRLRATERYIDPDFKQAYGWMGVQMIERLGLVGMSTHPPIWAWYQYRNSQHKRPDLRQPNHLPKGAVGYRVAFEARPEHVLLSDFDTWHHVLNYLYLPHSEADHKAFLARHGEDADVRYSWDRQPSPQELEHEFKASWSRIFDLDWHDPYINLPMEHKMIQGCVEQIDRAQVTEAERFVSR